jgi:integrase
MEALQMNIKMLVDAPEEVIEWIKDTYDSEQTRKSYISAILAVFRHNPALKESRKEVYKKWYDAFAEIHNAIEERYKRNEPTQKQKDVYVPFQKVIEARDKLERGSYERLLLAFYTYLPPLRCDFNRVRLISGSATRGKDDENYITIDGKTCVQLVLNEYKTKKGKDRYEKTIPKDLCDELNASLQAHPRDWLFVDKRGQPFSAKSYTQWANRVLAKVLGKRMTVSMLRHAFINSLDFNKLTVAEKEDIAKDMAHTVGTQDRYRLIF